MARGDGPLLHWALSGCCSPTAPRRTLPGGGCEVWGLSWLNVLAWWAVVLLVWSPGGFCPVTALFLRTGILLGRGGCLQRPMGHS